jgi:benzil reductase ((S)-benzoin forming)
VDAAIVTGVSRGLGAALAALLLERRWTVIGVGRSAAASLNGSSFRFVQCDLADIASIRPALAPALHALAGDAPARVCLINNAALAAPAGVIGAIEDGAIDASLTVNLTAPTVLCNVFIEALRDSQARRLIINVSSGAAQSSIAGGGVYSIAKAGLEMLTQAIAAETPQHGVEAINLRPGIIDTDMQVFMRSQDRQRVPSVDMFRDFHSSGQLQPPERVADKTVRRLLDAPIENGRTYRYAEL